MECEEEEAAVEEGDGGGERAAFMAGEDEAESKVWR
jgi:hypothetical protein